MEEEHKEEIRREEANEAKMENQPKEEDLIKQATEAAERLENANARLNQLLDRQERLKVREALGGTAEAGRPGPSKEEKETEEAKKLLAGTGYEDILNESNI